ncbi:MAG: adenylate/guanylate cyclase domain-containing protein, partial [Nitrospinota bacterium]
YYLFAGPRWWLNATYPTLEIALVYTGITVHSYLSEEKQRRFIHSAFGTYLSPKVAEELVRNPGLLTLGGERKIITAFFSDITGFTNISEGMEAEQVVELLNEYLSEMTDIILAHDGTVDKFEGDAIVAFFGAPHPMEDHALRACLVSLEMQRRMEELRPRWCARGWPELHVRIGLNTGPAVVGNMGSRRHLDYTMMGDTVNTAARLEGVNKVYGTCVMVGETTRQQAGDAIEVRELDAIDVVGKTEAVKVYQPMAPAGGLDLLKAQMVEHYARGLAAYRARQWGEALAHFGRALELDPKDGPSKAMRERIREFQSNPPPPDWNGAYAMLTK